MGSVTYFKRLEAAAQRVQFQMLSRGFTIGFGGAGAPPAKVYVPTDARSEFLANRALGDWAEKSLACAIREALPGWDVAHYGQSDAISAGEAGFREFYLGQLEQTRLYGKRPDLLLFSNGSALSGVPDHDISTLPIADSDEYASRAVASIEVRSSKVEAIRYMSVRKEDKLQRRTNSSTRETPSFTVKAEDLVIVYRWMERYQLPQTYCQVFFDSVFAMNFVDIFEHIADGVFKIENPDKSQGKATILIPITEGKQVGAFRHPPDQQVHSKVSRLGRHDSYIEPVFEPGNLKVEGQVLQQVLFGAV